MKKRILTMALVLLICVSIVTPAYAELTEAGVYDSMIAMKSKFPEGMRWTNDDYYEWDGGIFTGGFGCAGFAFALSDAAFGKLPARTHEDFDNIRVGDILRINNDSHSVIVLETNGTGIVIAEGNYNSSVHWGRTFTWAGIKSVCDYVMTRYPDETATPEPEPDPHPDWAFSDVNPAAWYAEAVDYCVANNLMKGTSLRTFEPNLDLNRATVVTVLYRIAGEPETSYKPIFSDVPDGLWYSKEVTWAYENGVTEGLGNGKFGTNDLITREQFATFLYRFANTDEDTVELPSEYEDVGEVGNWALDAMAWCVSKGLIQGTSATELNPRGNTTRAQCATILQRFLDLYPRAE